jgi:hypothetical protein
LGIFVIGGIPKDLNFAVVNNDHINKNIQDNNDVEYGLPQYCTKCNESSLLPYSCLFLEKLTASTLNLVSFFLNFKYGKVSYFLTTVQK